MALFLRFIFSFLFFGFWQAAFAGESALIASPVTYPLMEFSASAPPLYPWMLQHNSNRADWMGIRYREKFLYEPINILIADAASRSVGEAEEKLLKACIQAGYLDRYGHTSDYLCYIDGVFVPQFPGVKRHSLSDELFLEQNNHGRIFGPFYYRNRYWFYGAFSREKVRIEPAAHIFVSFDQARDDFAWKLDAGGYYQVAGFINLDNAILDSGTQSTGDHDGIAILIKSRE